MLTKITRHGTALLQRMDRCLGSLTRRPRKNSVELLTLLPEGAAQRIPPAQQVTRGLRRNAAYPAGKRIDFYAASSTLRLTVQYQRRKTFPHMANVATSGVDVYEKTADGYRWAGCAAPANSIQMACQKEFALQSSRHVVIFLPPFAQLKSLQVPAAQMDVAATQKLAVKPDLTLAVYGSSISQGCAASRPGLAYPNLLSRQWDCTVMNFGFSESAQGEEPLIDHLAKQHAKVYLVEYDHNATLEHLQQTHQRVYQRLRAENPQSLIVLMSRLSGGLSITAEEETARLAVIGATYQAALAAGDANVVLLRGDAIPAQEKTDFFSDDRHLNDLGMRYLADRIVQTLKERGVVQ